MCSVDNSGFCTVVAINIPKGRIACMAFKGIMYMCTQINENVFGTNTHTKYIQWNPSITDTLGRNNSVLITRCPQLRGFRYLSGRRGMRTKCGL